MTDERIRELAERFWADVHPEPNTGCLLWSGHMTRNGYGRFWINRRKPVMAHRFSYELSGKEIPAGMQLDHKCRVRPCVNPEHLRPMTNRENLLEPRSQSLPRLLLNRTACAKGHLYTPANTWMDGRARRCRTCRNQRSQEYKIKNAELVRERQRERKLEYSRRLREGGA